MSVGVSVIVMSVSSGIPASWPWIAMTWPASAAIAAFTCGSKLVEFAWRFALAMYMLSACMSCACFIVTCMVVSPVRCIALFTCILVFLVCQRLVDGRELLRPVLFRIFLGRPLWSLL